MLSCQAWAEISSSSGKPSSLNQEGLRQRRRREVARLPAQGADVAVARLPQCFQQPRFAQEAPGETARRREADHLATEEILDDAPGVDQLAAHRRRIVADGEHVLVGEAVGLQIEQVVVEDLPQPGPRGLGEPADDEEAGRSAVPQVDLGHGAHAIEALVEASP